MMQSIFLFVLVTNLFLQSFSNPISHGYLKNISEGETITLTGKTYEIVTLERNKAADFNLHKIDTIVLYLRSTEYQPTYATAQLNYNGTTRIINQPVEVISQDVVKKRLEQFNLRKKVLEKEIQVMYRLKKESYVLDSIQSSEQNINIATYKHKNWFTIDWVQQCAMPHPPAHYEPVFELEWKTYRKKRIALFSSAITIPLIIGAYFFNKNNACYW